MDEAKLTEEERVLEKKFWTLYRNFFDLAEKNRRWSIRDDIPWDQCNPHLDPAIADVVESFTAVELYLPDYTSKILPIVRSSKGRTWFYANWGYEESKHSLALGDWLTISGHRSDEQMADLEGEVFQREWNLPHGSRLGMMVYAMTQELATWLAYRNLRLQTLDRGGDPALCALLMRVAVDERAHFDFFRQCVQIHLEHDRPATLEQMRRVMTNFQMPAIHDLLSESKRRVAAVKALHIMDEDIYYREIFLPILAMLRVDRRELRERLPSKKSLAT
jgi:acyl-[acyl-carrier-protein] desaturase